MECSHLSVWLPLDAVRKLQMLFVSFKKKHSRNQTLHFPGRCSNTASSSSLTQFRMKHKSRTAPSSGVSWLEPTDLEIYLFSFSLRCQEPLTDAADSVSRSAAEHPQVSVAERWWKMFQTIQEQRKRPNPDPLKPCTYDNHSSFIKVYILIFFVCLRARH